MKDTPTCQWKDGKRVPKEVALVEYSNTESILFQYERMYTMKELVFEFNNQAVVSSRIVANHFGKEHRTVLRDIREIMNAQNCALSFYEKHKYKVAGNNRFYPEYYMNRDGFMLLVMGFNTKDAIKLKAMFFRAFNEMEEKLKGKNIIVLDEYNRNIQRLMNQNDEWERKWKMAVPYIKLGAVAYELAQDTNKVDLTYAFVKGMKSND